MNIFQRGAVAFIWIVLRFLYRIDIKHIDRIPEKSAILAPNHVSFIDAALIAAHVRRPVHFAMHWRIYKWFKWIVRPMGAFPIASKEENAQIYQEAFQHMRWALIKGDLVCIFPEGMLTLDGELNPFRNGVLKLLDLYPTLTVPIALKGLWGTYFSRAKPGWFKLPVRWMSKITMEVGEPLTKVQVEKRLEPAVRKMIGDDR